MEGQSNSGNSPYLYQNWSPQVRRNTYAASTPLSPSNSVPSPHFPSPLDLLPNLLPQQSAAAYQQQLANYNKLIASGGRSSRVQSSPLPPQLSPGQFQTSRKGSSSHDSSSSPRSSVRGHGNRKSPNIAKGERSFLTTEDTTARMSDKKFDIQKQLPSRPLAQHHNTSTSQQSVSVPTTPHQHPRKFSLSSREPSPGAAQNHSPRSAYSETNSTLPSLRPLPPKYSGCKYETAMQYSRRRMAYSIGTERLEKIKPEKLKAKLTEDDERKLSTDMRELYDRILPTTEGEANRTKFVQKLEKMLNDEWPGHDIKVHMFGSSGNMLCTDESDVDICITTEWKELENVCKIAELLARNGMEKVVCVSTAKVPIVKIWDPELKLACDMNVNNTLALENTRMMKTYVQIDDRVRPLAMIIKHWTRRRIVNDAAFGGTLSSYTWICMIVNFLQTRTPPIVPALHQRPHQKLKSEDGKDSSFGDDVDSLKTFGKGNHENIAQLLFHFFRFYAHEMDYDNDVISVRNGKLITKKEKGWHLGNNNMLCVEEPFNVNRNLANTADDTSFRGLHQELRRAFDLIAEGKLEECCEEYIFPKEEERIWEKPPPQPRPVISRTPSQTGKRGGRGGRGNRWGNNHGGGRRVSTGAYETHNGPQPFVQLPQPYVSAEWLQAQSQMHADLNSQLSQLKAQENNLRSMLYQQSQQYAHMQAQANFQLKNNGGMTQSERNRGGSFDNPPMTAPLRQDMYFYPMLQPTSMYGQHSPSAYPSSPLMSPALPELRRASGRQSITNGTGSGTGSGSSLRSHSQPASRSMQAPSGLQGVAVSGYGIGNYGPYAYQQPQNGPQMSNFNPTDSSGDSVEPKQSMPQPNNQVPKEYVGYYVNPTQYQPRKEPMVLAPIPPFADLSQARTRRPSTDQFPHAIFDRVRRTSRSPSPLGHNRNYSTDTNMTVTSGPQGLSLTPRTSNDQGPPIVNGSTPLASRQGHQPSSLSGSSVSEEPLSDSMAASLDSLQLEPISSGASWSSAWNGNLRQESIPQPTLNGHDGRSQPPVIVNGSSQATDKQNAGLGLGISHGSNTSSQIQNLTQPDLKNGPQRLSPNGLPRLNRPQQNGGMSPLDISGTAVQSDLRDDIPHLSPVYETRSPSPTANRKLEMGLEQNKKASTPAPASKIVDNNTALKFALANAQKPANLSAKANGHTRNAKSEGGVGNGWQKPTSKKAKGQSNTQKSGQAAGQTFSEKAPLKESDRKGG